VSTDGQTHTHRRKTILLSAHAICYSYGADKNTIWWKTPGILNYACPYV